MGYFVFPPLQYAAAALFLDWALFSTALWLTVTCNRAGKLLQLYLAFFSVSFNFVQK
jgi:hypothetical protein